MQQHNTDAEERCAGLATVHGNQVQTMNPPATRTVRVFDSDRNTRIPVTLQVGDTVTWKRRGSAGAYRAEVAAITPRRIRLRLLSYDGMPCTPDTFVITSGGFLAAWRDGHRLTR